MGIVTPDRFIPYLEDTGLIIPVGEWVLRQARSWQDQGLVPLRVSVNISSAQFRTELLAQEIGQILTEERLEPQFLELELTESLLVENTETAVRILKDLKALGVFVSIDDFGTGYSSLNYLKQFLSISSRSIAVLSAT